RNARPRRDASKERDKHRAARQNAVSGAEMPRTAHTRPHASKHEGKHSAMHQTASGDAIPDGRVATPIILEMIRHRPGIKSVEVMGVPQGCFQKEVKKGPGLFLEDIIYEQKQRKNLRRESDGTLYLKGEQGGKA